MSNRSGQIERIYYTICTTYSFVESKQQSQKKKKQTNKIHTLSASGKQERTKRRKETEIEADRLAPIPNSLGPDD